MTFRRSGTRSFMVTVNIVVSLALAASLLIVLVRYQDITAADLARLAADVNIAFVLLVVGFTALNFLVAAGKWRYIVGRFNMRAPSFSAYLASIAASVLMGLVVPRHIAVVFTRGLTLKFTEKQSFRKGSMTVLYDMLFSVYTVFLFIPGIIGFFIFDHPAAIGAIAIGGFLIGAAAPVFFIKAFVRTLSRLLDLVPSIKSRLMPDDGAGEMTILDRRTTLAIMAWCILQHGILAVRNYFVVLAIGMAIGLEQVMIAYPAVYAFDLTGLTPGSLGVTEWTWTGTLAFLGVPAERAGLYAITNRLMIMLGQISVGSLVIAAYAVGRSRKKNP